METEKKLCRFCKEFFEKYVCAKNIGEGECDCPKCQGYCECQREEE